jgi:superkiller protein 3
MDDAIAEFRKAIESDPKFTPAYNNLAETLEAQGKLDEAERYYRQSLAQRPSAAVHNALGALLRRAGKPVEAEEQLGRAKALAPSR